MTAMPDDLAQVRTYPLTATQRGYYTAWRFYPDRPVDPRTMTIEWQIDLDVTAFQEALHALVQATDALRLRFEERDGRVVQYAAAVSDVPTQVRDFRDSVAPREQALAWMRSLAQQPFDLSRQVVTSALARIGATHWLWLFNQHHIITDFTGSGLIIERLSDLYQRRKAGETLDQVLYPSFLSFIEEEPADHDADKVETYLAPRLLPFLPARKSPFSGTPEMHRQEFTLGPARLARLRMAHRSGKKLQSHLLNQTLGATALLMRRLTLEDHLTIGTQSHGRYRPGSSQIAGPFIKTHTLSLNVTPDWTTERLLKEVTQEKRQVFRAARQGKAKSEPYTVTVNFIPTTMPDFDGIRSVEVTSNRVAHTVGVDLLVTIRSADLDDDVLVLFDMNAELARAVDPNVLSQMFLTAFDAMQDAGDGPIDGIPMAPATAVEAARERARCAQTAPDPDYLTLPQGFAEQVQANPNAVAAFDGDATLSYAELDRQSAAMADALVRAGIEPGEVVILRFRRSLDVVIAAMAVWRAGATVFALDADVPDDRAGIIAEDTGARHLLLGEEVTAPTSLNHLAQLKASEIPMAAEAPGVPLPKLSPDGIAYVMYTSGSTGRPKGIPIPHHAYCRHGAWLAEKLGNGQSYSTAMATTQSFETFFEAFLTLCHGGSIGIYDAPDRQTGVSIIAALKDDKADVITLTPSQLRVILDHKWQMQQLKVLLVDGEQLPTALARKAREVFGPEVAIQNWYGPTETTMACTMHPFDPDTDQGLAVPIGQPAPETAVHVLDAALNPVPDGCLGEICIGGRRLSPGYLNLPDQTRQVFVSDPFTPGGRLYRTGDLGRVGPGRALTFHGRKDDQVKVNGARTELAEVELAVQAHPAVDRAVVVIDRGGKDRLIAFYCAQTDIDRAELTASARRRLPPAIVPQIYHRIDKVPYTASGKTDRKALLALAQSLTSDLTEEVPAGPPPEGPVETSLAELWQQILPTQTIGRFDDFFELGGDSLAFVQMVLRVEAAFDLHLTPDAFGQSSTLQAFAEAIEAELPRTSTKGRDGPGMAPSLLRRVWRKARSIAPERPATLASADTEFEEVLRQIALITKNWPGQQVGAYAPLHAFNTKGQKPPLFWCFNGHNEPKALAEALGPDQPLFAMRSLQALADEEVKLTFVDRLAASYAAEIVRLGGGFPLHLGGNCQSGLIAERIATILMQQGEVVQGLFSLEHAPTTAFPGHVALFFGAESGGFNPFLETPDPQLTWQRLFRSVTWDIVSGRHGSYFGRENLSSFSEALTARLTVANNRVPDRLAPAFREAYVAPSQTVISVRPDELIEIDVLVRNDSKGPWYPTLDSGLALIASWQELPPLTPYGYLASGALPARLEGGESTQIQLGFKAPSTEGRFVVKLEMVEQGIGPLQHADPAAIEITV